MVDIITMRGAMSPFTHVVWTAIATSAYLSVRKDHGSIQDTIFDRRFFTLLSVPVALHFVWNLPFAGPFGIKFWILGFIAWVVVISLVQSGLKEIAQQTAGRDMAV